MLNLGGGVNWHVNLERICDDFAKDYLWQCWSWGEGQLTVNLKRICEILCKDYPQTVLILGEGSINSQLGKDPQRLCKDYLWQCWSWGSQSINGHLGKDPWRLCKDYLWQCWSWSWGGWLTVNLERIRKDFARITSAPLTMLILGGWLTVNLERIHAKTLQGLTLILSILGRVLIDSQLGKDLQRLCKDYLGQCWSWMGGGSIDSQLGKERAKTLQRLFLTVLILGWGWLMSQLGKDLWRLFKDYLWSVLIMGGRVDQQSTWKGSMRRTLQGLPLHLCQCWLWEGSQSTVNLERIHEDFARITSAPLTMLNPGGVNWQVNLERICEDIARIYLLTSDHVDHGEGSILTVILERIHEDFARIYLCTSDQCWSWGGGQSTVNLERIHKDFARITSAPLTSVDPGGGLIDSQLGKDLQRRCKD